MITDAIALAVNSDPAQRRWGRRLDADVLLEAGTDLCRLQVRDGRIAAVSRGPAVMPAWTVAFRAEPDAWAAFMRPDPAPGFHDIMALVKRGALTIEGDLRPFMRHIFWFKGLFAIMRQTTNHDGTQP